MHDKDPRWDTPGFTPPPEYVREMKRYGVIPESLDRLKDPIDFYATDRRYWEIVTSHYPDGKRPKLYENKKFKKLVYEGKLTNDPPAIKKR